MSGLNVNVADLLHRPGARRPVLITQPLPGLEGPAARVPMSQPVELDLWLESVSDGILALGHVRGRWVAECSRCLRAVTTDFDLELQELFEEQPVDDETYPLHNEEIDLEPAVRDTVLPELPLAPLCDTGCRGLCPVCGADRNETACTCETATRDVRWDALSVLRLDQRSDD
jgi:uncharacterized protein